jgi:hypothetical protein
MNMKRELVLLQRACRLPQYPPLGPGKLPIAPQPGRNPIPRSYLAGLLHENRIRVMPFYSPDCMSNRPEAYRPKTEKKDETDLMVQRWAREGTEFLI